jgi:amidase
MPTAKTDDTRRVLLEVQSLRAGYGRIPILHGIDLAVREGETVGVLGHNGMGKSTLLKTLIGLIPATAGRIAFDGSDVTAEPTHERNRAGLGYVPQGRGIFPNLSVRDNLRMGTTGTGEMAALDAVLADFPRLERLLDRRGGSLSGGEQQLLALARCLIGEPRLALLDEPTEGIQPSIIKEIAETLRHLREQRGLTILLVEQNLDFITALSDRVLILQKGRVVGEVAGDQVKSAAIIEEFAGFGAGRRTSGVSTAAPSAAITPAAGSALRPPPSGRPLPAALPASRPHVADRPLEVGRTPYMTVKRPTLSQLGDIVAGFGMTLSDDKLARFLALMEGTFQAYDQVDALPDNLPPVDYPRTPGYRPPPSENPLNAWYIKTEVRGAPRGPLAGKRVVLKDNVCLAGVPMMNGASTLEGYTPDVDATVVTRILDAGGTIVGKAHCEYFCLSGGSHTNATGPVHNPYKMGYSAGGSSSGSGALVAAGEVEMAIGGDQGGSIRMPAAFSGCYGMKPTHGLVPYTGIMPIEITIDHAGPITATVADNALLLEVIAGEDGLDPRQFAPKVDKYTAALGRGVKGMRIGVVREGFGLAASEADVDAKVRAGAQRLAELGAEVSEISVPMHALGHAIWTPIALEGLTDLMMKGNGFGTNWKGLYVTSLLDAHSNWRARADELSDSLKIAMFAGEYFQKHYRGRYYAKAQNLSRQLRAAYDAALDRVDLLLMPTLPMKATPIPPPDAPLELYVQRAFEMIPNTAPFDATGHPAMSIPCGMSEGLPIGLMLIGRHWKESTIYQAAHAFEQLGDWRRM